VDRQGRIGNRHPLAHQAIGCFVPINLELRNVTLAAGNGGITTNVSSGGNFLAQVATGGNIQLDQTIQ
jgi:hypothetical protein